MCSQAKVNMLSVLTLIQKLYSSLQFLIITFGVLGRIVHKLCLTYGENVNFLTTQTNEGFSITALLVLLLQFSQCHFTTAAGNESSCFSL